VVEQRFPRDVILPGSFGGLISTSYPIHWASYNGRIAVVNVLIEADADVNVINYAGDTALHLVCKLVSPPIAVNARG
jgi:ankyrin repeat protein